jgi:anthranilate phosphoribosyltransferase
MEQMGYKFKNDNDRLKKEIDGSKYLFLHAPFISSCIKNCCTDQMNLAMRTFFKHAWSMVNPSHPKYQLVGVFSLENGENINYLLQQTENHSPLFTVLMGMMKFH